MNDLYKELNRGDGTCKFFNESNLTCSVYNDRPEICNIDVMYKKHFVTSYNKQEFYTLNLKECDALQQKAINKIKTLKE